MASGGWNSRNRGDGKEVSVSQDGHNIMEGSSGGWCCHNESGDK